jgi:hypothetical protein
LQPCNEIELKTFDSDFLIQSELTFLTITHSSQAKSIVKIAGLARKDCLVPLFTRFLYFFFFNPRRRCAYSTVTALLAALGAAGGGGRKGGLVIQESYIKSARQPASPARSWRKMQMIRNLRRPLKKIGRLRDNNSIFPLRGSLPSWPGLQDWYEEVFWIAMLLNESATQIWVLPKS